jgi:hypothetical protein
VLERLIFMKKDNSVKLSIGVGLLAVVICMITAIYSYHLYDLSLDRQQAHQQSLDILHQKVARLEAALTDINSKLAAGQGQTERIVADPNSKNLLARTPQPSASQRQALKQMEQILDSTGLARLAENENIDPDILQQMYDEYAERNQIAVYRQQLMQKNGEHLDADRNNYGEDLMSLYELARLRRGSDVDRETREKAYEEMLEKYPDAYATAKVIGERAVRSAFRRNTAAVEEYYDMLRQNDKFASVTTERGMEVMPNVEHYLAQQYLRGGRMEDARVLRDSLELNFTDSYILTREPGTGWKWLPVSQVVSKLDQQLK